MRGGLPSIREAFERAIRDGLGGFLHQCEGPPPDLIRVTLEYVERDHNYAVRCLFAPDRGLIIRISERGLGCGGLSEDDVRAITRQIYYGLFEDHMVNLEVRQMRRVFNEARERGLPPDQLWELDRNIRERERHIRQHHHGITPQALGVPDRAQTATEVRVRQRQAGAHMDALAVRLWSQQLSIDLDEINIFGGIFGGVEVGDPAAQAKGLALLKENLTPVQLEQYEKRQHFEVVGCDTRKLYRIKHGRQMNIEELDKRHRRVCGWCFLPQGALVVGDVLLAQKIALETNETAALKIANRFG